MLGRTVWQPTEFSTERGENARGRTAPIISRQKGNPVAFFFLILSILCAGGLATASAAAAAAEGFYSEAASLRAQYAAELAKLAVWCDGENLAAEAKTTRAALGPHDACKIYIPILPVEVGPPKPPENAPAKTLEWHKRFFELRRAQAAALYDLAQRAVRKHQTSLAYQLLLEVIRDDPDHAAARRVFGYQNYEDQWHTAYEVAKLRNGFVWHEKFGWVAKANLAHYEADQRPADGRWISPEADARNHASMASGWNVETEHYMIRTNHSIEAGVALGRKLETLQGVWRQMFVSFYAPQSYVEGLLTGRGQGRLAEVPRFNVRYFRNRDEYLRALRPKMPGIEVSAGFYHSGDRIAYFYAGGEETERILNHEATHQLFQQSRRAAPDVGRRANCWIVEGIALFMESLHREGDFHVLGDRNDPRMVAARYHVVKEDFYMPFNEVTAMGLRELQTHPKIAKLYSQFAAMTHFLIFADGGRNRDALVSYLSDVYHGSQDPALLARKLGTSYAELDRQYQDYLKAGLKRAAEGD
jgi:hypothetical protein